MHDKYMRYLADTSKIHAKKRWIAVVLVCHGCLSGLVGNLVGTMLYASIAWWAVALFGISTIPLFIRAAYYTILPGDVYKALDNAAMDWDEASHWPRMMAIDSALGALFIITFLAMTYPIVITLSGLAWNALTWAIGISGIMAIILVCTRPHTRMSVLFFTALPFENETLYHGILSHLAESADGGDDVEETPASV